MRRRGSHPGGFLLREIGGVEDQKGQGSMSNRELPMMPWYPDQFAGSTRCWSFNERSLYRALLDVQWAIGSLPSDPRRLADAVGMPLSDFETAWKVVGPKFVPVEGGLINKRLEAHRLASLERKKKASRAGRSGGRASGEARRQRSLNGRLTDASTDASTVVERDLKPPSPSPSPVSKTPLPPRVGAGSSDDDGGGEGQGRRADGTHPRARSENPRANGTHPRGQDVRGLSLDAWRSATAAIDHVNATTSLTWAYVTTHLQDSMADAAIEAAGGHRLIADRDRFNQGELEGRFRTAYESRLKQRTATSGAVSP